MEVAVPIQPRPRQVAVTVSLMPDTVDTVLWAPDDGWKYHSKHVEQLTDINELYTVASCWIIIAIHYTMHGPLNIKNTKSGFLMWTQVLYHKNLPSNTFIEVWHSSKAYTPSVPHKEQIPSLLERFHRLVLYWKCSAFIGKNHKKCI